MPTSNSPSKPAILGGPVACNFDWPIWPMFDNTEEELIMEVLRSRKWWYGDRVKQFESDFAAFQGAKHAVSCTNGTTAIEMGLRAIGVVERDEVIVPPYSFIATASAVVTVGAIPIFADIDPNTLCIDPMDIERKISPRTKAIIPVHVSGRIADMEALNALAAKHDLQVFEDAAHAWGSQFQGHGAGTLSRAGTFSFQETKNITAGEGGILVTNDGALADLCRSFTHCGRKKGSAWYDHDVLGSNLRMTEFQAAILIAQTKRLENQVQTRMNNAKLVDESLQDIPGLQMLTPAPEMTRRSYHMYIFRVDEELLGISRDRFLEALNAEGVPATAGWYRPLYRNGLFVNARQGPAHGITSPLANRDIDYKSVSCPVCEQVCRDAVWIPQNVLLADEAKILQLVRAIQKVAYAATMIG